MFFYQLEEFEGTLHDGITEHVDAQGDGGGTVGLAVDVAFEAGHAACLDADLTAYLQLGGVDGDGGLGISYHPHEVLHLDVGDAGEVGAAIVVGAGSIHHEVKDELGLAGYLVALGIAAADEEVTGTENLIDLLALARTGPDAHLLLYGDIGLGPGVGIDRRGYILMKLGQEGFELLLAGFFGIGGDYSDKPAGR